MHTPMIAAASIALAAGVAMAAGHAQNRIDTILPDAPALAAYGELKVGVRALTMTNPGQVDILSINPEGEKPDPLPSYDRELAVEVWYPAVADATGDTAQKTFLRNGKTEITIHGQAMRDAAPALGKWPLVIVSHGYPGNRFLMSHLAENIASKGYVVASIDHRDSTYRDQSAFGSTLVNRSLDQLFVLDQMAALGAGDGFLGNRVDAETAALIGYSMGGYGAVITAGGGVTEIGVGHSWGAPHGTLAVHQSGTESHNALPDARIKTAIAFAPWGYNAAFWNAETLKGVQIPMLFVAGSVDDVSGYDPGVRSIWREATGVDRALLTYDNANHNAGAPMPPPQEGREVDPDLGWAPYEHYADAVWSNERMNNIAQHFVTAWLDQHLKGDAEAAGYLDLVPNSNDGVWKANDDGSFAEEHSYWKGFPNRSAKGLRYEVLKAGE